MGTKYQSGHGWKWVNEGNNGRKNVIVTVMLTVTSAAASAACADSPNNYRTTSTVTGIRLGHILPKSSSDPRSMSVLVSTAMFFHQTPRTIKYQRTSFPFRLPEREERLHPPISMLLLVLELVLLNAL